MRVRLTRKLAGKLNGVNLRGFQVGDVLDLPGQQARLLLAEGWAVEEQNVDERDLPSFLRRAS